MNDTQAHVPQSAEPFFDLASETVRFWVVVDGALLAASVGRHALHYRFRPNASGEDPMETFAMHIVQIEAAVRQRIHEGAREPVMLREYDLRAQVSQGSD